MVWCFSRTSRTGPRSDCRATKVNERLTREKPRNVASGASSASPSPCIVRGAPSACGRLCPNVRASPRIAGSRRNLLHRPARPALGNGRLQKQCRRCLRTLGTASTSDAIAWSYRELMWAPRLRAFTVAVYRALRSINAVRIARVPPYGAWLWRLPDRS